MEILDHYYGFVLYRHQLKDDVVNGKLDLSGVRDRGYLIVGSKTAGVSQGTVYRRDNMELSVNGKKGEFLHILVENMGRVGFGEHMDDNKKGIISNVTLNGVNLTDWLHFPITMDDGFTVKNRTENRTMASVTSSQIMPSVYVGSFMILEEPQDTYIDMSNWRKGQLFINGQNMGRYWPQMGPQVRLFVPGLFLQIKWNRVVLVELEGVACPDPGACSVEFVDQPLINATVPEASSGLRTGCSMLTLILLTLILSVFSLIV